MTENPFAVNVERSAIFGTSNYAMIQFISYPIDTKSFMSYNCLNDTSKSYLTYKTNLYLGDNSL